MGSKKNSNNISVKIKNAILKHKVIAIIVVSVLSVAVVLAIIIPLMISNNNKKMNRKLYSESVDYFNDRILDYNSVVDSQHMILDGFESRGISVDEEKVYVYSLIEPDYTSFEEQGHDIASINEQATAIEKDRADLLANINELEVEKYNALVDEYNVEANKFNSLAIRLSGYNNGVNAELVTEYDRLSQVKSSWIDIDTYFQDYDSIVSEKTSIESRYSEVCRAAYNAVISDYNVVADAYNKAVRISAIDFITGLPAEAKAKLELTDEQIQAMSEDELCNTIDKNLMELEELAANYLAVVQVTCPSEAFVKERLANVPGITGSEAVTSEKDPNGLLGKKGGYSSCTYFSVKDVKQSEVKGNTIVDKGTDGGGAIEVYDTVDDALNRCDYLSQFDGTLLYSGSYVVVGTMVVRTSYKLSDQQQIDLTSAIIESFTKVN